MTQPRRPIARWFAPGLAIGLAALISGCGGIFSDTPHRPLYQLKPAVNFGAPMRPIAAQLLVALPTAPTGLDTARVALSRASVSLDYFADAEWADSAPIIVQSALVDAFGQRCPVPPRGSDNAPQR